jgi:hypothetical protein
MKKVWYKSKGLVAGVALCVKAVLYDFWYMNDPATAMTDFFVGLGLIGIRQALE